LIGVRQAKEITLDACDLEPPEPYELATAALKQLQPGQYLRLLIPRQPRLLYPWLIENGFQERTRPIGEDLFEVYIWSGTDADTGREISSLLD
jgi:hypothetical protein